MYAIILYFDVAQADIDLEKEALKSAREGLEDRKPKFTVSVIRGTGAGEYEEGQEVTVTADPAEEGKQFKNWSVEGVEIPDNTQSSITRCV